MCFKYIARSALSLSMVISLAACGTDLPSLPSSADTAYRLGAGDDIRVITFGEERLTAQYHVSDSGLIAVPLLGSVRAAGLTTEGLADRISNGFKDKKLLRDPSVSVEVQAYRPIYVLGEVTRPGEYPYTPGMTVAQAAAKAGGFTYRAITKAANVIRNQDRKSDPIEGSLPLNGLVQPGDVVNVEERLF